MGERRRSVLNIQECEDKNYAEWWKDQTDRSDNAPSSPAQLRAHINREIHRIGAWQHLAESQRGDEALFVQPAAAFYRFAVQPSRSAAAKAGNSDSEEHVGKREEWNRLSWMSRIHFAQCYRGVAGMSRMSRRLRQFAQSYWKSFEIRA